MHYMRRMVAQVLQAQQVRRAQWELPALLVHKARQAPRALLVTRGPQGQMVHQGRRDLRAQMVLLVPKVTLVLQGHRVQPELPVRKAQQVPRVLQVTMVKQAHREIPALLAHKATRA